MEWETHCEECGKPLVDDPHWKDERYCHPCNILYLHPTTAAEIERRIAEHDAHPERWQTYTLEELADRLDIS